MPSLLPSSLGARLAAIVFSLAAASVAFGASLKLTEAQLERKGSAQLEWRGDGVRLRFDDPGWDSGVRLLPPQGEKFWDLSAGKAVAVDVENLSPDRQLRLTIHISSGQRSDKTHAETSSGIGLNPGEKRTLHLFVPHRSIYGFPKGIPGPKTVDSAAINSIELYMQWPFEGKAPGLVDCRVSNLRLVGEPDLAAKKTPEAYLPFIDVYGQFAHADWPEKIRSDADLKKARRDEEKKLAAQKRPKEWNRFGGWKNGPQLKATGHFRTEKHQGKWYFVDPEGRLFFSHGIDVLRASTDGTRTTGHESWFNFEVKADVLPFNHLNLQRKYGRADYEEAFYSTLTKRLEGWGINTIGAWGIADLMEQGKTPYTLQIAEFHDKLPKLGGSKLKFFDVFHPVFVEAMGNLLAKPSSPIVAKSINDPMCIGYFVDNELNFGNRGRQTYGDDVLKSPAEQPAKLEFVADLKAKYGSIGKLNASWETEYADWDALLASRETPKTRAYMPDSHAFFEKSVDRYFQLCRDGIKKVAPHRLYLGCRFISTDAVRPALFKASEKYCDVLTTNVYAHSVANLDTQGFPDMPVLIGEFHFGVLDRGMFAPGISAGLTQDERALAYTRFLQGALVNPKIVGTHWFQFRDQPLTGRWDGEGYAIGFVDVADTPYAELTKAARSVGEGMYAYRQRGKLNNAMR